MPAPPNRDDISGSGSTPSNGQAREGFGKLWDYATGLLGLTGNPSEAREALGLGSAGSAGNRNLLINGNFIVNQRLKSGTVVLAAGAYGHDRWKAGAAGCTYTFTTNGADTVITISSGSLVQVIEGANVAGTTYCASWVGSANAKLNGGSYSASGVVASSVAAGANLTIEFGVGSISLAQVEAGSTPTSFERRPYPVELSLCQRYLEVGSGKLLFYAAAAGAPGSASYTINFKVTKRATPTLAYSITTAVNVSTADARNPDVHSLRWFATPAAIGFTQWDGGWTAEAEI